MPAFFLSLLAALFLTIGARDQRLMADMSALSGGSLMQLMAAWMVTSLLAMVAAVGSMLLAPLLAPNARLMFLAIALLLCAVELFWQRQYTPAKEPTRSLFAFTIVLLWRQGSDGARFVLLGLGVLTANPLMVAVGGAIGGILALSFAWSTAENYNKLLPWRAIRIALAVVLLILAVIFAASARSIL